MTEQATPPRVISLSPNSGYYYVHFLEEVAEELKQKAFLVKSGLASVSKAEQFAYAVLLKHGFFDEEEPLTCCAAREAANDCSQSNTQNQEVPQ